jgi:hypothetical protein
MKDELATGVEEQNDPMAMPQRPEHDLGRNETIANERQVSTGSLITFANQIAIRTYDTNSQSGSTIATTFQQNEESDNDSDISSEEETTENKTIESDDENEEEEVTGNGSGSGSGSSSSQPSGDGTSEEDEDNSDNSENERLMKLLMSPQIRYRLLQEAKKSKTKNSNKTKSKKGNRKERKNKDLTPTKSSLKTTVPREVTPPKPKLAGKTGQQRASKASDSGGRGAGVAC